MAKYEIMLVLAPTENIAIAEKIAKDVFANGVKKVEKLERTELAYPINKSNTGIFALLEVETEESNIAEFVRRTNIQKTIWRTLVINLDSEKGLNRKTTPKKVRTPYRRNFNNNSQNGSASNEETNTSSEDKNKRTRTTTRKVVKQEKE